MTPIQVGDPVMYLDIPHQSLTNNKHKPRLHVGVVVRADADEYDLQPIVGMHRPNPAGNAYEPIYTVQPTGTRFRLNRVFVAPIERSNQHDLLIRCCDRVVRWNHDT